MVEKNIHTDCVTNALETASVLRTTVLSIYRLEETFADQAFVHQLSDIRRAVQASARRIDDLADDLDRVDSKYFGAAGA